MSPGAKQFWERLLLIIFHYCICCFAWRLERTKMVCTKWKLTPSSEWNEPMKYTRTKWLSSLQSQYSGFPHRPGMAKCSSACGEGLSCLEAIHVLTQDCQYSTQKGSSSSFRSWDQLEKLTIKEGTQYWKMETKPHIGAEGKYFFPLAPRNA